MVLKIIASAVSKCRTHERLNCKIQKQMDRIPIGISCSCELLEEITLKLQASHTKKTIPNCRFVLCESRLVLIISRGISTININHKSVANAHIRFYFSIKLQTDSKSCIIFIANVWINEQTNRLFVSLVRQRLPIAKCLHCFKRSLYSLKPNIIWRERALFSPIHSLFLSLPALSLSSNVSEHWVSVCHSLQSERFVMNDKFTMNESFLAGNRLMKWECHAVIGALRIRLSREKKIPLHRQWSVKKFDNNKNQMAAVDRCNVPFSIYGQTQAQLEQTK